VIFYTAKYHLRETRELAQTGNIWRHRQAVPEPELIRSASWNKRSRRRHGVRSSPAVRPRAPAPGVTDKLARAVDQLEMSHLRAGGTGDPGTAPGSGTHDLPTRA